jgi:hypothetical protein
LDFSKVVNDCVPLTYRYQGRQYQHYQFPS